MKSTQMCLCLGVLFVGGLTLSDRCYANPTTEAAYPGRATYHRPASSSALNYLPFIGLPDRFLFSGVYTVHLSRTEMRIDHMALDSRCTPHNRTFMISAGFAQPVGQMFSSSFELPIFSADRVAFTRLAPASVGDYVIHLSDTPLYNPAASLIVTARF